MKQYTSNWAKLRTSDFVVAGTSAYNHVFVETDDDDHNYGGTLDYSAGTSISISNGIVYFSTNRTDYSYYHGHGQTNSGNYVELRGAILVWKGTFSG